MKPPKGTTSRYSGWSLAKSRIGELADLPQIYSKSMAKHHSTWVLKVRFYKLGEPWALVSCTSSFPQSVKKHVPRFVREAVRLGWLAQNQSTSHILWEYLIPKQLSLLELHFPKNHQPKFSNPNKNITSNFFPLDFVPKTYQQQVWIQELLAFQGWNSQICWQRGITPLEIWMAWFWMMSKWCVWLLN